MAAAALALPAVAQRTRADSLLRLGAVDRAEAVLFAASAAGARGPRPRAELAAYLAARGRLRVASVLLEEARRFGGDTAAIDRALVPLYERLGDHRAEALLPPRVVGDGVVQRARWLVSHQPTIALIDSAVVEWRESGDTSSLGQIAVRVDGMTATALVVPRATGVLIDRRSPMASRARRFAGDAASVVIDTLRVGDLRLTHVAATLDTLPPGRQVIIGLDALAPFHPAFSRAKLVLRTGLPPGVDERADRVPLLLTTDRGEVAIENGLASLASPRFRAMVRDQRWIVDARRGVVLITR